MRWSCAFTLALFAGLSAAHADPNGPEHAVPKIFGGRKFLSELRGRKAWESRTQALRQRQVLEDVGYVDQRDNASPNDANDNKSGRCGGTRGACAAGYCCSAEGWCGLGTDYCEAPDCQLNYGPGCDGNQKPDGVDTSSIVRTRFGKVQYGGVGVYDCVNKGDIAITFDDGPYNYTNDLLDKFKKYGGRATFFITGNNIGKGMINDPDLPWRAVIQRMAAEGHQIASHTWSHQNFSQMSAVQAQNQMLWNEIALNDILGYIPTYMRPPFSICPAACQSMLVTLGYHAIYFDLDTEGYLHDDPTQIQTSKDIWDEAIDGSTPCKDSYLNIEHDIHYQSVYNLTDYFLDSLFKHGYRSVTVGQCLGDPPENWYRAGSSPVPSYSFSVKPATGTYSCLRTTTAKPTTPTTPTTTTRRTTSTTRTTSTPTATLRVSNDGLCGTGVTCKGSKYGNCCSENGYCGASVDYCGDGCQAAFGVCFVGDSTIPPRDTTTSRSTARPSPTGPGIPDSPLSPTTRTTTSTGPTSTATLGVSTDGSCGNGITCSGSAYGNCCSEHGWCGVDIDYCGDGCQIAFGSGCQASGPPSPSPTTSTSSTSTATVPPPPPSTTTTSSSTTSANPPTTRTTSTKPPPTTSSTSIPVTTRTSTVLPPPAPTPTTIVPSRDGRCGPVAPGYAYTCRGSGYGLCCNGLNRCALLCLLDGCQPEYGTCSILIGPGGEEEAAAA
ncbi:uncharacterized protein JN550_010898 [Neoarthrinium moseri]|uniref:uncharacterized protein n=1 Tax=Neoarthrinium moseri TaxID=1658444 RepID=UPI001FDDD457|nr:uncharacterized protein JN550_010898 [Neoarthrinium moseri]KAI1861368.1 hypothetical protein JN550_010898 [Neoarthrinium moseri]